MQQKKLFNTDVKIDIVISKMTNEELQQARNQARKILRLIEQQILVRKLFEQKHGRSGCFESSKDHDQS